MNTNIIAIEEIFNGAREIGISRALFAVFGSGVKVSIPFSKRGCETSIELLNLSVRAHNALKRAGAFTVGEVIDRIASGELIKIRNLGAKTAAEIKAAILEFGYGELTEKEQKSFIDDVIKRNAG